MLSSLHPNRVFAWALCLALWLSGAAVAGERGLAMRVDFLPNLIYDGDPLTLCVSLVNRTAAAVGGEVRCVLAVGRRTLAEPATRVLEARPGGEDRFETMWRLVQLKETATLTITLTVAGETIASEKVAIYPASLRMPALTLGDGFLTDEHGHRVVLVVRRQVREPESRWALLRYLHRRLSGGRTRAASALFLGDQLTETLAESYVTKLRSRGAMERFTWLPVAHPTEADQAGGAIYRTLAAFSQSALSRPYDLAVLFVGSEEARFGTDAQEFRRAIDLMSGLLKKRGTQRVVFVAPIAPAPLAERIRLYDRHLRSVAHAANARVFSPQAAVTQAGWGTGVSPGPAAMEALAEAIADTVEAITAED